MSEFTQCNYCSLQQIRSRAKAKSWKVTKITNSKWGMGGVNIYVHPKDIKIFDLKGGEDGERSKYRVSWFMELPERCCC